MTKTILAFDFGEKRIGVAVGNTITKTAEALKIIQEKNQDEKFKAIEALIQEWQPQLLVVGLPTHPDGAEHENTLRARKFGRQLRGRFGLPVFEVDERYSTTEAHSLGAKDADAAAAAIILEQFLRNLA